MLKKDTGCQDYLKQISALVDYDGNFGNLPSVIADKLRIT